jgi:phosphatidylethanolamine-binding protein (PEBP) family uncharacterized protein
VRRLSLVVVALVVGACARGDGRALQAPAPGATAPTTTAPDAIEQPSTVPLFSISSPSFTNGAELPEEFTCDGAGDPPPLAWANPPAGVTELALVVADTSESGTIQWVVTAIPPTSAGISPGSLPAGAVDLGYQAPCPQPGEPAHVYTFTLYGLTGPAGATPEMTPSQAADLVQGLPAQAAQMSAFFGR